MKSGARVGRLILLARKARNYISRILMPWVMRFK